VSDFFINSYRGWTNYSKNTSLFESQADYRCFSPDSDAVTLGDKSRTPSSILLPT
jgi:hypothetical protein